MSIESGVNIMLTKKKIILVIVGVVVIALVVLAVIFRAPLLKQGGKLTATMARPWYAVHLNNGQVYFGQIKSNSSDTLVLKKTYLLEPSQNKAQVYNLNERGKRDPLMLTDSVLYINRAAVLFWEKLTPEAEVVKSIMKVEELK